MKIGKTWVQARTSHERV